MQFQNKTAVVSGAASGMGLLFCQEIIRLGGNALLADINEEALRQECDRLNAAYPGHAAYAVCDVRRYEEVRAACEKAVAQFGSIDIVVPFAGGAEGRICHAEHEFPDNPIEIYDWSIDVNLKGQLYFDHAALRYMREQKSGVIIHIGSITGEEGCALNVGYSAAKSAAMNGMTKSVARYGMNHGIRCCCVAPGPVLTRPGMATMKTALGRAATPEEMVNLVLYVASEEGAFLNGINILSDGGRNILLHK